MHPIFKIRYKATEGILELLESVTLGTNGAHYRHLDTRERIYEVDDPLFLTMERNDKVIGNVTFCRRQGHWYVRYFAFSTQLQSSGTKSPTNQGNGLLKRELTSFFDDSLKGTSDLEKVESFYAYIDPRNEKSLWMSETFEFSSVGKIATQTFSRTRPRKSIRLRKTDDWNQVKSLVENQFGSYNYYIDEHTSKGPFYVLEDDQGEIIGLTKTTIAHWQIKRLPGKNGGLLTKLIPWIPGLRKIIRPNAHTFVVPEAVVVKNNDPKLVQELFEGILFTEKLNLILWWVDEKDELYKNVQDQLKWGLLHKMVGVAHASVVQKTIDGSVKGFDPERPVFTTGIDFI